ncbi:MAG: heterocyst development glycosyltransferase HepC [Cyanobacteria bacterium P01_D01_bin.105]
MVLSTALLKTPRILSLLQPQRNSMPPLRLIWRRNLLLVEKANSLLPNNAQRTIPALQNLEWCEACLYRSPIKAVRLSMNLGEETLRRWADACNHTGKRAYVHLPSAAHLPKSHSPHTWRLKRIADWLAAALLLMCLSPLMLLVAVLIYTDSPGPIFFRQWRVGHRGKLFQIIKFRTMRPNAEQLHHQVMGEQPGLHKLAHDPRITAVGHWLRKYSLDELPQLFNVLRGEMSLVGPRPWALYDAVRIEPAFRYRLNALPGVTGAWQVSTRSNEVDISSVSRKDLAYLADWSVLRDLRLLLLTVPKVISGSGSY